MPWSDCDGGWHGYHHYLWDFLHHIYSGDNWCGGWQLMWPFRFVTVPVWGHFGLWPFWSVAVPVCGRFGLWPFWFVAVLVCGHFGLWPFRFVAVSVCGHFGCGHFGLWPLWPVTSLLTTTFTANNICQKPKNIYMQIQGWYCLREDNLKLASEYLNVTV